MIPYLYFASVPLGPVHIQVWGFFVALGIVVGVLVGSREAVKRGLDKNTFVDLAGWVLVPALIGGRLFHVFVYDFAPYLSDPWSILYVWEGGMSSFGGFIGAGLGAWLFLRIKKLPFFPYAEIGSFAFPLGYGIGRIGCFFIHDHPGTLSDSFIAVGYPGGARLDHGLLLSLLGFGIFGLFLLLRSRVIKTKAVMFFPALLVLYGLVRLPLDSFRAWDLPLSDVRYFSYTPAQYGSVLLVILGIILFARLRTLKVFFQRPSDTRSL